MAITHKEIEKVAELAQIAITEPEYQKLHQDLNNIMKFVNKLDQLVDIDHVIPLTHPFDAKQLLRDDSVTETNQRALFQSLAPDTRLGFYLVPKVLDLETE